MEEKPQSELSFDKDKWRVKEGSNYPFRPKMLNAVLYNDSIRTLNSDQIKRLLGPPDKATEGYLYYLISQKKLGSWPLTTKTMVVKFKEDNFVEWVKVHN